MVNQSPSSTRLAFVLCTEPGILERKSRLFVESLRRFGGRLKDAPVYSLQPRKSACLLPATRRAFERLGVTHIVKPLNREFRSYGFANKVLAAAFCEVLAASEFLVFADSDQVVLCEPSELLLPDGVDAALRPVHTKNVGTDGRSDRTLAYWNRLYEELGVRTRTFTETTTGEWIFSYWNGGLVSVRRAAGIFSAWERNFRHVMKLGLHPESGMFFVEQTVLAATLSALGSATRKLPRPYNYPLPLHDRIPPAGRIRSLEEAVTVHYHQMFDRPRPVHPLEQIPDLDVTTAKARWLRAQLVRSGLYPDAELDVGES